MEEIWKPIEGFESYEVSNFSRVRKAKTGYIIKPVVLNTGYLVVRLSLDKKVYTKTLHRIVAKAFIPNPHNYPVVNHINEDRTDARIENLEWCTQSHNIMAYHENKKNKERLKYWEDILSGRARFEVVPEKRVVKKVKKRVRGKIRFVTHG